MQDTKKYYKNQREEMSYFLPKKYTKVLDVGCGEGGFRKNLSHPNEYWGVELVSAVANLASINLDKVITGTYLMAEEHLPEDYFDLVICNDVIEHMTDHDDFLERIKKKMTPDGVLVLSVPNVRYLPNLLSLVLKKDWAYTDEGILDRTHLRFFTQKSLINILKSNGYQIECIAGINAYKDSGFWLKRIVLFFLIQFLGQDTKYLQFGIRARKNHV